jgi:hypothetical protein
MNSTTVLFRVGGPILLLAALLFAAGGVLVLGTYLGMVGVPASGLAYYLGLVLCAPGYAAWYATIGERGGTTASIGFVMAAIGAVAYATGAFLLLPIGAGVDAARDVWDYATVAVPVLPIGGLAFFVGSMLLAAASLRSPLLPRWAAVLALIGFAAWLIAFFAPPQLAVLLFVAGAGVGLGLGRIGWAIWSRPTVDEDADEGRPWRGA